MAKEASIAPKERVNIVYKPAVGDAKEEVELPLKVLVMGDFTMEADDTPIEDREAVNIDKDNFNDALKSYNVKLDAMVENKLSDEPDDEMRVELDFNSLSDFNPDAIVEKIPELKKLVELRNALKAVKGPLGNIPEFKKRLNELVTDPGAKERILKELGIEE
ncbi:Type VI secretion protein, VC_A0107 family [Desulfamplus magnetovallimortis]|uniref:Type VI secretion protein, VC_A0107 family n=1 Tax=Desulfamplus magnetovallimortis TaxID=1246637 RepID=L0R782_9BACT|nr:type VI secretion system contractile sheath small subunit [Desulfamplus magnetovallimortis]CCO06821.1 Type VI secretion protein, VC_A0107 family [Desulfamplus magnetovallimortis BW-1]SLM32872.1 Type VI secretion protein, VC_A0107 family [Desulfamplus magnetovallimortis]